MSYCEHKTKEAEIMCKHCTTPEDRKAYVEDLANKAHQKAQAKKRKIIPTDSNGIPYQFGNRAARRRVLKRLKK